MQTDWSKRQGGWARRLGAPLLTLAVALVVELLAETPWRIPNPPAFLVLAVVFGAFVGGRGAGLISAAIAWAYSAYFFSEGLDPISFRPDDGRRVVVWAFTMPAMALLVGTLRRRLESERETARQQQQRLEQDERLRVSEARFRAIADSAPVGIFETDAQGQTLFVNRLWCELTGRGPEGAAGLGWLDAVHPEDRERVAAGWCGRPRGERLLRSTFRMLTLDGGSRWVSGQAVELVDPRGRLSGYLGTLVDVTETRRAEEIARRRESILASVSFAGAQLLRGSSWVESLDAVLRALGVAAGASRAYLFENAVDAEGELCSSRLAEWVAAGIEPQIGNAELQMRPYIRSGFGRWLEVLGGGGFIHGRVDEFPADERALLERQGIVSLVVVPVFAGERFWGVVGFDNCVRDRAWSEVEIDALRTAAATLGAAIERQLAEAELRASELRFRELFDSSPVEIWEEDFSGVREFLEAEGFFAARDPVLMLEQRPDLVREALPRVRILDVNRQTVERLGASSKADLLAGLGRVFTDKAFAALRRELVAMHRGETQLTLESLSRTFDGRTLDTVLHWEVQAGHEHDFSRVLVSVLDVTEQRELRQQLERSNRLETVGKLAGGIAHDFNNLLMVIQNSSQFVADELAGNERLKADMERVMTAARRAAELTRQLLAFSRRQVLSPQSVDLNSALRELRSLLDRVVPENIDLRLKLCRESAIVEIDPAQLEQVLMNLVVNARDALPEGGTIEIRTSRVLVPPAGVPERVEPLAGGGVMLAVRDTGLGMDRETLERCFEPFYSTKAPGAGSGLGLATTYGIVRQSGGAVWAESEPGEGATFFVFLPGAEVAAETPRPVAAGGSVRGGEGVVLLVEDDDAVRGMVGRMLLGLGYAVRETRSPLEALALLAHGERVDLLLTDVVMAEISGERLAELARESRPGLRVLFMSGYAGEMVDRPGGAQHGFLPKPFTLDALAAAVRDGMARGRSST